MSLIYSGPNVLSIITSIVKCHKSLPMGIVGQGRGQGSRHKDNPKVLILLQHRERNNSSWIISGGAGLSPPTLLCAP